MTQEENKFVPNDVFKYSISLKTGLDMEDVTVYTKPFPEPWEDDYDESLTLGDMEDMVQEKYFTKNKIDELKKMFVERIMAEENPFNIFCVDVDGGYNVTEDQLFQLD